jgi:phosphoglycolate phosphatase
MTKHNYKIIFDFDNTLVNSWPVMIDAFNATLAEFSLPIWTEQELKNRIKLSARDFFPQIFGKDHLIAKKKYTDAYLLYNKKISPLDYAKDLLSFIKEAGLDCYIISNKRGYILRQEIEYLQWNQFFSKVTGAEDYEIDKPDPKIVEYTLNGGGLKELSEVRSESHSMRKVIFIGDSDVDFLCAKQSFCLSIGVFPDKNICYDHSPDIWCNSLKDVEFKIKEYVL